MDIAALAAELTSDPLTRIYSGMTDQEAADSLNAVNRTTNKSSMTGDEILNQVDAGDWAALTDDQRQTVWDVCHLGSVDPFGVAATLLTDVFGASTTIIALQAARKNNVSRAVELGLGTVLFGHVKQARNYHN